MISGLSTEFYTRAKCGQFQCIACHQWDFQAMAGQALCRACETAEALPANGGSIVAPVPITVLPIA